VNGLDTLLDRSREAKVATPAPMPARAKQVEPEIKSCWIQTAAPRPPNFAGAIEPLFYFVDDGAVTCVTRQERPAEKTIRVGAGDDPRRIAALLKRSTIQPSDFNRALDYPNVGVA
jgi:hypothetical protein